MEKEEIIYDLEASAEENTGCLNAGDAPDQPDLSVTDNIIDEPLETDPSQNPGSPDTDITGESAGSAKSEAEMELDRMVGEIGAETLLSIIRDNRNAAIRQIISEVEASRDRSLPSGKSAAVGCSSIFDLAAMA